MEGSTFNCSLAPRCRDISFAINDTEGRKEGQTAGFIPEPSEKSIAGIMSPAPEV